MTKNEQSTLQTSNEGMWAVDVGRETFVLTDKQKEVLKQATKAGNRGIVWFDEFAISIPHIQSIRPRTPEKPRVLCLGGSEKKSCKTCGGEGQILSHIDEERNVAVMAECEVCGGSGEVRNEEEVRQR